MPWLLKMATPSPGRFTIRFWVNSAATSAVGLVPLSASWRDVSDATAVAAYCACGWITREMSWPGDPRSVVRVGQRPGVGLLRAAHQQEATDAGDHERGEDDPAGQQPAGEAGSQAEPADEEAAARPTRSHGSSLLGERRRRMGDRSQSGNGPVTNDLGGNEDRAFPRGPGTVRLRHALSEPQAFGVRHG